MNISRLHLPAAASLLVLLTACVLVSEPSAQTLQGQAVDALVHSEASYWRLYEWQGQPPETSAASRAVTLRFARDGGVRVTAGCYTFHAAYTVTAPGRMRMTLPEAGPAYCNAGDMREEQMYLAALSAMTEFTLGNGMLTLHGEKGGSLTYQLGTVIEYICQE